MLGKTIIELSISWVQLLSCPFPESIYWVVQHVIIKQKAFLSCASQQITTYFFGEINFSKSVPNALPKTKENFSYYQTGNTNTKQASSGITWSLNFKVKMAVKVTLCTRSLAMVVQCADFSVMFPCLVASNTNHTIPYHPQPNPSLQPFLPSWLQPNWYII